MEIRNDVNWIKGDWQIVDELSMQIDNIADWGLLLRVGNVKARSFWSRRMNA